MYGLGVTCPDTLAPNYLNRVVTGPGAVATFSEDNKRLKYAEISWIDLHLRPYRS